MILLLLLPYLISFVVDHFYLGWDGVSVLAQASLFGHLLSVEVS